MRFLIAVGETVSDIITGILYFIENNLRNMAMILEVLLPYIMLYIGQDTYRIRGKYSIGGELFTPILIGIFIAMLRGTSNKLGKGITVPTPTKRFTEVSEDGEVSVDNNRLQELILYQADLEDWLERKGLL